jgi:cation transport ATPase
MDIKKTLWIQGFLLIFMLLGIFVLDPGDFRPNIFPLIALAALVFLILGIVVIVRTFKKKIKGKLKTFLLLSGISSTGALTGTILHNLFYALGIMTQHFYLISQFMEFLHAAFFIISVLLSPIGFVVGTIGSLILLKKADQPQKPQTND